MPEQKETATPSPDQKARKREYTRRYLAELRTDPERYAAYKARVRAWQLAHPEAHREAKQRWRERNPEYDRKWVADHPGYSAQYYRENRERINAYRRTRYAAQRDANPAKPCLGCGVETHCKKYCTAECYRTHTAKKR